MNDFTLKHHGVRGSIPCSNFQTNKYGGNTPCVELRNEEIQIIFDCGSGFSKVKFSDNTPTIIFISHFHHDHIQGLPFNEFKYNANKPIYITNGLSKKENLKNILKKYLSPPFFPINFIDSCQFLKFLDYEDLVKLFYNLNFEKILLNHPGEASGYSLILGGSKICYLLDNEFQDFQTEKLIDFCSNAEIVIWDGMYTQKEIAKKKGWGHSTIEQGFEFSEKSDVKKLIISHHSPYRYDKELDNLKKKYLKSKLIFASENEG